MKKHLLKDRCKPPRRLSQLRSFLRTALTFDPSDGCQRRHEWLLCRQRCSSNRYSRTPSNFRLKSMRHRMIRRPSHKPVPSSCSPCARAVAQIQPSNPFPTVVPWNSLRMRQSSKTESFASQLRAPLELFANFPFRISNRQPTLKENRVNRNGKMSRTHDVASRARGPRPRSTPRSRFLSILDSSL